MAINIGVNDVVYAQFQGTNEGMPWAHTWYMRVDALVDHDTWITAYHTYLTNFYTAYKDFATDKWTAECVTYGRASKAGLVNGPQGMINEFRDDLLPITGTVATDGVPNQSAVLYSLHSDTLGASGRGRMYNCGVPEAATNAGLITAAAYGTLDTIAGGIRTPMSDAGNDGWLVVFSRTKFGPHPGPHPADNSDYAFPITQINVVPNLASQRRRRYRNPVTG